MNRGLRLALLLPAAALIGCTLPSTTSTPISPTTGAWQNWQIQAGAAITSPPTGLYFVGAVQFQGTQSAAAFSNAGLTGSGPATVLNFLGTYNSSTGNVGLLPATTNSAAYGIGFTEPATNTVIPVDIYSGCVYPLNYQGVECLALVNLSPAIGVQIAPLSGTYTGTLIDSADPSMSGTGTLTLTQSSTPDSNGAFPLTATVTFPTASNLGTTPLGGTVSGEEITLNYCSPAVVGPCDSLAGSANPTATQITVSSLTYNGGGTNNHATFTGTLTRQ